MSPDPSPPSLAVIIVNYTTAQLAVEALRSVLTQKVGGRGVVVHLVDNASPGADADIFRTLHAKEGWGEQVVLHLENENHGFGRGNNIALTALAHGDAPPQHVLLLNPDATLTAGALGQMAQFLDHNPQVGCVGAAISRPDHGPASAAFRFPGPLVEFISAANVGPLTRLLRNRTLWHAPDSPTMQVDWVAGAAVMFRLQALRDSGFFDPDFFLYFEEVELMWRLKQRGWPCWYLADAQVLHHEGVATNLRSGDTHKARRPAYWYASQRMYYAKTRSRLGALGCAMARWAGASLHFGVNAFRRRPSDHPSHYLRDFGRLVLAPLAFSPRAGANHD